MSYRRLFFPRGCAQQMAKPSNRNTIMKSLTIFSSVAESQKIGTLIDMKEFIHCAPDGDHTVLLLTENSWFHARFMDIVNWCQQDFIIKVNQSNRRIYLESRDCDVIITIRVIDWRTPDQILGLHGIDLIALDDLSFLFMLQRLLMITRT